MQETFVDIYTLGNS